MDEQKPVSGSESTPEPQPTQEPVEAPKRPPLTPLQLRKRYLTEGFIVLLVCLWFMYDGWFNPEIKSKSFNKVGTIILAWWFLWDMYQVLKYHRAAKTAEASGSNPTPPGSS